MEFESITQYRTLIFDCDGVVLDSNHVKTQAFYQAALPYGLEAAQKLVDFHTMRGGMSRYLKFDWFLRNCVKDQSGPDLEKLLESFGQLVHSGLLNCPVAEGLDQLRMVTQRSNWMIVSGGDQAELRRIFVSRQLDTLFDGGIFGSPATKEEILNREKELNTIRFPALFIGDSQYDHQSATQFGIDFLFRSKWTEFLGWKEYCQQHSLQTLVEFSDLL